MTIRLALMSAHYRQPLNWSASTIDESINLIKKFEKFFNDDSSINNSEDQSDELVDILSDDLNTPEAITYLSSVSKKAKTNKHDRKVFISSCNFLGFDFKK